MVDKYLNCTRTGCDGVAVASDADTRRKNLIFVCQKCGNKFTVSRSNYEFGMNVFNLGPGDWMRSGMK